MRHREVTATECTNLIAETLCQAGINSLSIVGRTSLPHKLPLAFKGIEHIAGEANGPAIPNEAIRRKSKQIKLGLLN